LSRVHGVILCRRLPIFFNEITAIANATAIAGRYDQPYGDR
jgi:hypothetical protein